MKSLEQKRREADARNAAHASLTPDEKLARIRARRGNSEREQRRLTIEPAPAMPTPGDMLLAGRERLARVRHRLRMNR